ncbi:MULTISPECIES: polysaccharide ABC transporter ATP-binding protein [unclassified Leucobacter]|uniref:ABC transporter ATP-binding protein n=1 Tax=unclassified Leucobacter TaxID=2621730 RepID=UPI00165D33E2|nr:MULTISPECIES: polysaccharide ABC transporter ATP-binding protein [unclassified Leucobacter]MBC9927524.1 ATP-binding cassette domain-containing protein [Leucobacter sp. cx-169]
MEPTTAIKVENVTKRFLIQHDRSLKERLLRTNSQAKKEEFLSLDSVSTEVRMGDTVGLIGHNGSGKSTLLKVIGGILEPTSGRVLRRGRLAALLELGAGFNQDLTGRENIFLNAAILGLTRAETNRYLDSIIAFSELEAFIDTQVKFYSSGMYVRLAFAVAVHVDPDVLLVDEVLAVGDEPFQRKCLSRISEFQAEGRTIVLVSHSADQIASVCNRAVVLDSGKAVHDGDVGIAIRVLRDTFEFREAVRAEKAGKLPASQPPVEVLSLTVENLDRDQLSALVHVGDTLRVRVEVEIHKAGPWMCGINFSTPLGHSAYRADTNVLPGPLPEQAGRHRVEFTIPGVNFGSSRIKLDAAVASPSGEVHDKYVSKWDINMPPDLVGQGDMQYRTTVVVD